MQDFDKAIVSHLVELTADQRRAFQQELCKLIVGRMKAQGINSGNARRTKIALELIIGAAMSLELTKSPHLNGVTLLAMLVSARGVEVIDNVATTGNI